MLMFVLSTVLLAYCANALPQQPYGAYNQNQNQYNQNQYNQNQYNRVQPIQNRPQPFIQSQQQQLLQQQGVYNPQSARNIVPITSYQNEVNYDGSYQYSYTSGDGSQQQARGYVKNLGQKGLEAQVVQGSYSYISPDGTPITVTYIADENGFRAEGAHLPTPPPIPDAIAKSLQTNNPSAYTQNQYSQSQYSQNQYNQGQYNNQNQYTAQNQNQYTAQNQNQYNQNQFAQTQLGTTGTGIGGAYNNNVNTGRYN